VSTQTTSRPAGVDELPEPDAETEAVTSTEAADADAAPAS